MENANLQRGGGHFLAFIDSDDVVDRNYISAMYDSLKLTDADICVCDYIVDSKKAMDFGAAIFTGEEILDEYVSQRIFNRVWNKLYRCKAIEHIRFPDNRGNMEDAPFMCKTLLNIKKLCRISTPLYYYRTRMSSLLHSSQNIEMQIGYYENAAERFSLLIANLRNKSALEMVVAEFFKSVLNLIMADIVKFGDVFQIMRNVAVKNDLKITVVVQNKPSERLIFQLLLASKDWQTMRKNLQKYIVVKK